MSSLSQIMRRLVARTSPTTRYVRDVEQMALRDWADLPAHHPQSGPSSS